MAPTKILKHDDNIAQQFVKQSLKQVARLLRLIGKPFYILLITSINIPIIFYYTIRHIVVRSPGVADTIKNRLHSLLFYKERTVDTNSLQKKASLLKNEKTNLYEVFAQNSNKFTSIAWLLQFRLINKARSFAKSIKLAVFDIDSTFAQAQKRIAIKTEKRRQKIVEGIVIHLNEFLKESKEVFRILTAIPQKTGELQEVFRKNTKKIFGDLTKRASKTMSPLPEATSPPSSVEKDLNAILKDTISSKINNLFQKPNNLINFDKFGKKVSKDLSTLKKLLYKNSKRLKKVFNRYAKFISKSYKSLDNSYLSSKGRKKIKAVSSIENFLKNLDVKNIKLQMLKVRLEFANFTHAFWCTVKTDKPRVVLFVTLSVLSLASFTVFAFWLIILKDLPSPQELTSRNINVTTKIYDRNGILLYNIYKDQNRSPVALADIPSNVRLATIAIEDAEFYSHPGFSIRGIARAFKRNIERGQLTGGSTITQQLVKNALLTSEKTIVRKVKEVALAVQVELTYNKDQILEMYLNEVSYGGTAYGVQEAARMYFEKDVNELSLAEAALLAGLPKSPTQFSPFGPSPVMAKIRQKQVLNLMQVNGFITKEQAEEAGKEEINFAENKIDIKAPHFVMYIRNQLDEKYGKEVVEKGGLEVVTTLDYEIQQVAERVVKEEVDKLAGLNVGNGAVVILDPSTGEILSMVGSKNYFDTQNDGNVNIVTTLQSPGSSIKVVNYAYALSNGFTPATIVDDAPITYQLPAQPPYIPRNYDGQYKGKITIRTALAESRNIPAVKVLNIYGVANMIELGRKMGITTWEDPSRYGLALTLGGGDVKLLDLAQVYATIANYGKRPSLIAVKSVTNFKGKVLEENYCQPERSAPLIAMSNSIKTDTTSETSYNIRKSSSETCETEQVVDPRVSFIITDILRDNNARSPAFGSNSQLVIPNHKEIAVKTGTSNELRDNLTVGYNQNYLVAVWVGNNDNSPMSRIASGVTGAAPIFNKIMTSLVERDENHDWEVPIGLVKIPICSITGTLPCEGCPSREEWFLEENQPKFHCSKEFFENDKDDDENERDDRYDRRRRLPAPFDIFNDN